MTEAPEDAIEARLEGLLQATRRGRLDRRGFVRAAAAWGLSAPAAMLLLADQGLAQVQAPLPAYKPTRRGGGGTVRLLFWQAPTLLNPHFATGNKDGEACSLFYESLAVWTAEGHLVPVLATEIPSRENGGLAADGRSVVWKLKRDVKWQDGTPFTADDVIFNAEYAADKAAGAFTAGAFTDLRFEKIDAHTVRVVFPRPQPFWPGQYAATMLLPRHLTTTTPGACRPRTNCSSAWKLAARASSTLPPAVMWSTSCS